MLETIQFTDLATQSKHIRTKLESAIQKVLDHGMYVMGPEVFALEAEMQHYCDVKHAISCANGTDALSLILKALDIGPNDAVFVPSFTFAASAEVVALLGATPIFIDVKLDTYNIDPESLNLGLELAKKLGLNAKAVMTVDLFGLPADYDVIVKFCEDHNLLLIADAAQSFGAQYKNRKVGNFGIATATSFYPAKPLGCYGDGGAIFTNDGKLAEILKSLRVHGQGHHKYENVRIGFNGRLDTLQAAILLEKLKIFPEEFLHRAKNAKYYSTRLLKNPHLQVPALEDLSLARSSWAQYTITVKSDISRDDVISELKKHEIPTVVYYPKPLHCQTAYCHFPRVSPQLKNSEYLAAQVLSLPMHPYLTESQQDRIMDALEQVLSQAVIKAKTNQSCEIS